MENQTHVQQRKSWGEEVLGNEGVPGNEGRWEGEAAHSRFVWSSTLPVPQHVPHVLPKPSINFKTPEMIFFFLTKQQLCGHSEQKQQSNLRNGLLPHCLTPKAMWISPTSSVPLHKVTTLTLNSYWESVLLWVVTAWVIEELWISLTQTLTSERIFFPEIPHPFLIRISAENDSRWRVPAFHSKKPVVPLNSKMHFRGLFHAFFFFDT